MPGSVRQRTILAPVKKTSWWLEQVATWRDLRGLLYSYNDYMYSLIQSKYVELQPSMTILIWISKHFDHLLFNTLVAVNFLLHWVIITTYFIAKIVYNLHTLILNFSHFENYVVTFYLHKYDIFVKMKVSCILNKLSTPSFQYSILDFIMSVFFSHTFHYFPLFINTGHVLTENWSLSGSFSLCLAVTRHRCNR